ncbi:hypothetical protein [Thermophilibacter immobilis]|jgi:uncharacterized protein (DUF697 family)|uniref:Uncharacterized protein n=1 Tax=Thermophilibacter immobilis TaxID=2779519 RepID=A0A7S7M7K8_9ACTN|nr:hypothetical protein [Thermophilibacter immobilis]QOY59887.1 hypothetical protein INP52_05430 [Thermophilibacter immobilis]
MAKKKTATATRFFEVLSSGKDAFRGQDEAIVVRVHVDPTCPRELALAVKGSLVAERPGGVVEVRGLVGAPALDPAPDVALVLVGSSDVSSLVASYARAGVFVGLVVEGALDAPDLGLDERSSARVGVVAASSASALTDKLGAWLASVSDKRLALAANFAFCRRAVVDALVRRCALENAAVGAVSLVPGSDLPLMCANQATLALDIAAAYGRALAPARAVELAGVVGAGFAYRAVARTALELIPGLGGALKAGVGYSGTLLTGHALRLRFEAADEHRRAPAATGDAGASVQRPSFREAADARDGYVTIGNERA